MSPLVDGSGKNMYGSGMEGPDEYDCVVVLV
jgi:hypothetical protein